MAEAENYNYQLITWQYFFSPNDESLAASGQERDSLGFFWEQFFTSVDNSDDSTLYFGGKQDVAEIKAILNEVREGAEKYYGEVL